MSFQALIQQAEQLKDQLDSLRQQLDNETIRTAWQIEYTYESNRIEGNSLTLRETQLIIQKGITIGGKPLREHLEAINHQEAVLFIEEVVNRQLPFTEMVLKQLHQLVLYGIDRENAGVYRRVPVMIAGSHHLPPQPYLVQGLMDGYFRFYRESSGRVHPIDLAAKLHERLVTIHPFVDGNGRTARLVMNLILLQHGYPVLILGGDSDSRLAYYNALEEAASDEMAFVLFISGRVIQSLQRYLHILQSG